MIDFPEIKIGQLKEGTYEVVVRAEPETTHRVHLIPQYHQLITDGKITEIELVDFAFHFLLQREPNTHILRSFDLPVIQHYFSDFEDTVRSFCAKR